MEIKTTEEISIADYTHVAGKRWVAVDDVIKMIQKKCHGMGYPDFNGENHIIHINGTHWKELSEKFEKEFNTDKAKITNKGGK